MTSEELQPGERPPPPRSRVIVTATWDDAPHLTQAAKDRLWQTIPPYQRAARSKGVPSLGAGAIYPIAEDDIKVKDFPIPDHWPRGYGMDVGWNRTAGVWGARDPQTQVTYLYSEHYRGEAEPVVHTNAFKARGDWQPGKIDPAARGRNQVDGQKLVQMYRDLGLHLTDADNAVETGLYQVWTLIVEGRLKVFSSLTHWFSEFRMYRRNEKGEIIKKNDHLMDASRYHIAAGFSWLKPVPSKTDPNDYKPRSVRSGPLAWMGG